MGSLGSEIRQALRRLAGAPAVTAAALLCLAVGAGASTAVFTAVNAALLRPLPFAEPDALVRVFRTTPHFRSGPFAPANFLDLRRETTALEVLGAVSSGTALVALDDASVRASVVEGSDELMPLFGLPPLHGRLLGPGDEASGEAVAVVGEGFWRGELGADAAVVGATLRIDGEAVRVVGVAPRELRVAHGGALQAPDLWLPLRFTPEQASWRRSNYLGLLGRLRDGMDVAAADEEMKAVMGRIVAGHPELEGEQLRVQGLHEASASSVRGPLRLLLGAVGFVLLIAAANVASLLLARGVRRRGEWAVRAALGAGRGAVVRGALVESAVLAGLGAAAGLAVAWLGVAGIEALVPSDLPQLAELSPDARVLAFALALTAGVTLAAGVVPAWQAARTDPQTALRGEGRGGDGGPRRLLSGLVVAEVALCLVLLAGAGLVLRGFQSLVSRDPGFETGDLLTMVVNLPAATYEDRSAVDEFLRPALARVEALPGVLEAGSINVVPYDNWGWNFNIRYEGQPDDQTRLPLVERRVVSPGFFDLMGMTLLRGRLLAESDDGSDGSPPVVVVNRALVERDFPGEDPVGRRFHTGDTTFATIVGVVSDIRNVGPVAEPRPEVYWTYAQGGGGTTAFPVLARVRAGAAESAREVAAALREVEPALAVSEVRSMDEVVAASMGRPRFYLALIAGFAGVAFALAMAGLYGVTSYAVAQRRREIGIRTALGSTPAATVGLIVRQGLAMVAVGAAVGGVAAALLTGAVEGMLYGVSPVDPLAWAAVVVVLVTTAALALLLPASRAARADPLGAIRAE